MNEVIELALSLFLYLLVLSLLLAYEHFFLGRIEAANLFELEKILSMVVFT